MFEIDVQLYHDHMLLFIPWDLLAVVLGIMLFVSGWLLSAARFHYDDESETTDE